MDREYHKKRKKKRRGRRIFLSLIFLLGLGILSYPIVSRLYYRVVASEQIALFDEEKSKLVPEEVERRIELAKAYNAYLNNAIGEDPYSPEKKEEGRAEYARMLEINEQIGHVQIPTIDADIPIYAGTTENVLQKGAGHLEGTSLPVGGISTHTVITAHSGLPTAKLFSDLNKLEIGDKFYIHNLSEVLAYQVDQILVIDPSNFEDLLIVKGHDYATLLTCTPIMINTHRLIVRGHRVEYVQEVEERIIAENKVSFVFRYLFYASCGIIFLLLLCILFLRKKKKRVERRLQAILEAEQARNDMESRAEAGTDEEGRDALGKEAKDGTLEMNPVEDIRRGNDEAGE